MESLAHEGRTMIVVTHQMVLAREAADRVYQVISNPQDERTRAFLKRFLHQ